MTDLITTLRDRAPRYQIKSGADLTIVIKKEDGSSQCLTAELAEANVLERREHPRERITLQTTALRELGSEASTVSLVNYSRGGFCLLSQESSKPGERTLLRIESEGRTFEIPGTIRWQFDCHEGYVIGCEFLDSRHFTTLCRLAESHMPNKAQSLSGSLFATLQTQNLNANDEQPARRRFIRHAIYIGTFSLLAVLCTLQAKNWIRSANRHVISDPTRVYANDRQLPRKSTEVPVAFVRQVDTAPPIDAESTEKPALDTDQAHVGEDEMADVFVSDSRKWVDNTGRFSVIARVVDLDDDMVQLQTESGRQISVPLRRLSGDDARHLRLLAEDSE